MRIPFDGLVCRAAAWQLGQAAGARIQKVVALGDRAVALQLFDRRPNWLTISWDPEFFRLHLAPRTPERSEVTPFVTTLRKHLEGASLLSVTQQSLDRVVRTKWGTAEGEYWLVAELMGKHCHLVLTDASHRLLGASQWVGPHQSKRPLLPGQRYEAPPPATPVDLATGAGLSPFLIKLLEAGLAREELARVLAEHSYSPVLVPGAGIYPIRLDGLGVEQVPVTDFGEVLDLVMHQRELDSTRDRLRRSLEVQFDRAILAREVAVNDLEQVLDTAARAAHLQLQGELILAHMGSIQTGDTALEAWDYEGNPMSVPLRSDLDPKENAQRFFAKAKRAKNAAVGVGQQLGRIQTELEELRFMQGQALVLDVAKLLHLKAEAMAKGYFRVPRLPTSDPSERPYAGHKVRVIHAAKGFTILVGENSEANDYITLRVAKPSDVWLHVRGSPGAHVIIQVPGKGAEVPPDVLHEGALAAARNSPQKHSSYVPVDWTQKRYVRRVKGGGPGVVHYEREKTVHVDPALKG